MSPKHQDLHGKVDGVSLNVYMLAMREENKSRPLGHLEMRKQAEMGTPSKIINLIVSKCIVP